MRAVDPLFVFAFMQTFVDTLRDYLGEISVTNLRDHFDIVYQVRILCARVTSRLEIIAEIRLRCYPKLLEEMLDDGYPLTTERNALRDIVLPPSLLNKILSLTGTSELSKATANPFSSPIPWRKANVKHNNNEIYFDIVEDYRAVVNRYLVATP